MHQFHLFNRVMFGCYVMTLKVNAKAGSDLMQVKGNVAMIAVVTYFLPFRG
jgi:hypothetical protein